MSNKSKEALELRRDAQRERLISQDFAESHIDDDSAEFHGMMADRLEKRAADLLKITGELSLGHGGEVIEGKYALNTLAQNPDAVNVSASARRYDLTEAAGVDELAIDAAESIKEPNSLEKMLAHQMALCHDQAFSLTTQANMESNGVEKARLLNSAARMMKVYQEGFLTLNRVRTGGTQRVIVQHVQVNDGGQAVVAGQVKREGGSDGAGG